MKRIALLILTNIAVVVMLGIILTVVSMLTGINFGQMAGKSLNVGALFVFALVVGFAGSIISLFMSKSMAKMSMGVQLINTDNPSPGLEQWLVGVVRAQADKLGLQMPEVGIYEGEPNAFATGASKNSSLVAVSTGLLSMMNQKEVEAVLAHEMSHVANGDMVTMTLIQGVTNTFVVFLSRLIGWVVDRQILRNEDDAPGIGYYVTSIVLDIAFGLLAGIIVGAIFIIKGCKKDDAPADDAQNTNQPVDNIGDTTTPDNVTVDDELLTLVNPWNPLPDDWTVDLVTLDDGHRVDSRCYEAYMEMINACKAAGYSPVNCSGYRTQETQQSLYDNKVQRLISSGMSEEEAKTEAAKAVAIPGTSEHQLGLAVDLVDANMQDLTSAQESTETQKWLMANSWRYGFIHRYPNGKTDITGIIYEPWHYRYVGKDAAQEIFNRDITLEEYLGKTEH